MLLGLVPDMWRTRHGDDDETETDVTETRTPMELPPLLTHTVDYPGPDHQPVEREITGRLIGSSSSGQDAHQSHTTEWADRKVRCSRCRWIEIDIYTDVTDNGQSYRYLVHTVGRSDVPGEKDLARFKLVKNAMSVVEALVTVQGPEARLTVVAREALAEASGYDEDIREEFRSRRVQ